MKVSISELRRLPEGQVIDIRMIDAADRYGYKLHHPGITLRMRLEEVVISLLEENERLPAPPGRMQKIVGRTIRGAPVFEDTPEHVTVLDIPEDHRDRTKLGIFDWMIKEIEVVND